jgi:hypothetical protein
MSILRFNRFAILGEDDNEIFFKFPEKLTHLELHPIATLIKYRNITHLEPHPISHLIKFLCILRNYRIKVRFNDDYYWNYKTQFRNPSSLISERNNDAYHDGILLQSELNRLERKLEKNKKSLEDIKSIKYEIIFDLEKEIWKIKDDCKNMCLKWLDQIHICTCGSCYYCCNHGGIDQSDLGRCRHYYQIEEKREDIYWNEECINNVASTYYDIKNHFEREKAKKEKYLQEYLNDLEEEYDNFSFQESMNYSYRYKEPVYVY